MAGIQAYARFNVWCGTNGTGKSTKVATMIERTKFKNVLVLLESVDVGNAPWDKLPLATLTGKNAYAGGRACIDADTVHIPTFFEQVAHKYRDGLLVLDEAGMYTHELILPGGEPIPALKELLKQRRKYNVEVNMIYHSASEVPVRLFKWVNNVILFHQTDKFAHKGGVIPMIEQLNEAKERIRKKFFGEGCKQDVHYCERIQLS